MTATKANTLATLFIIAKTYHFWPSQPLQKYHKNLSAMSAAIFQTDKHSLCRQMPSLDLKTGYQIFQSQIWNIESVDVGLVAHSLSEPWVIQYDLNCFVTMGQTIAECYHH